MRKFGDDDNTILYYAQEIASKGWNRELLSSAISLQMHKRKNEPSDNNFEQTLPATQAMFANEVFRSGYNLGFLGIKDPILETELEARLVEKVKQFLLELGKGFAFLGREYRLQVGETEQFIDMLFYNIILHCYVVVEVKVSEFTPADIGQLITYVSAVDGILRKQEDAQTIGLLICKTKDNVLAKYATAGAALPIGISEYELSNLLPDKFKGTLPSISEIENELKAPDERS
jgi:predicted nuclease of restriction endonuclease-like (RecB) superfamily